MKNNKGFTLVELLVVMVILGIIMGLSFPAIRALQQKNEDKKFTTFQDSLKSSGKLYVDAYDEDLFGRKEKGCACIKFSELADKKLAKDISVKDISCDTENTFVKVTKIADNYAYASYIGCKDKKTNQVNIVYPKSSEAYTLENAGCYTDCSEENTSGMTITASPSEGIRYSKKKAVSIIIRSIAGINQGIEMYTAWSDSREGSENLEYKRLRISAPTDQMRQIKDGYPIEAWSSKTYSPTKKTGTYYLHVRVDKLYDLYDSSWSQESGGKYIVFGPYNLDNTPPVINKYKIKSLDPDYNTQTPDLTIDAEDNVTPKENLRVCMRVTGASYQYFQFAHSWGSESWKISIYGDRNFCTESYSSDSYYTNYYYNYFTNPISIKRIDTYNRSFPVYFSVIDEAGNHAYISTEYATAKEYKMTYKSNGGNACNPSTKTVLQKKNTTWGELCNPKRANYVFDGWYTASTGGTQITKDTLVEKDLTVYAHWEPEIYKAKLDDNGATTPGTKVIYEKYGVNWYSNVEATNRITSITKPTKTGYDFQGYYYKNGSTETLMINSSGSIQSGRTTILKDDGTFTAKWKPGIYKVTLNAQSATSQGTTAIWEQYNTNWYTNSSVNTVMTSITKPKKTGYTFLGYYTQTMGRGDRIIDSSGKIVADSNKFSEASTIYAYWEPEIFGITLDNNNAVVSGTSKIYLKYNTGWYSNSNATTPTTSIISPTRNYSDPYEVDYLFKGYYTGENGTGTKIIDGNGNILDGKTTSITSDKTLYAHWVKHGWELTNSLTPVTGQKWKYWNNGTAVTNGRIEVCFTNNACSDGKLFYFVNGYAVCGWQKVNGNIYYFTPTDPEGNGYLNMEAYGYKRADGATYYWIDGQKAWIDTEGHCQKGTFNGEYYSYCGGY